MSVQGLTNLSRDYYMDHEFKIKGKAFKAHQLINDPSCNGAFDSDECAFVAAGAVFGGVIGGLGGMPLGPAGAVGCAAGGAVGGAILVTTIICAVKSAKKC